MLVRITNHNSRETFPTHLGPIYFRRGRPETRDMSQRLVDDLKRYKRVHVEILEKPIEERPVDFSKLRINELRAEARKAGIERVNFLKKEELIKRLEESHGKHTVS